MTNGSNLPRRLRQTPYGISQAPCLLAEYWNHRATGATGGNPDRQEFADDDCRAEDFVRGQISQPIASAGQQAGVITTL